MSKQAVRSHFKIASEGRYTLHSEKVSGLVNFQPRRGTRLTLAALHGGNEEGLYMVYNVGDYLHIAPFDATDKDPIRSMIFNPVAVRDGFPCTHAHTETRDGIDLLVGTAHGEVLLMSLRAQLQAPPGSTKPILVATLNADNPHDSTRCNVVAWVPQSDGAQFLAAHASGTLLVYKKVGPVIAVLEADEQQAGATGTENVSRFGLSLSSNKATGLNPHTTINVPGGGVNDVAFSPDGKRLAVCCRDGGLRLLDWPGGQCVAGFQSYYGAALCCCWSPDAKYIGVGGEDDLVAMYCAADKQVVAWGEGHSSWVSRVAFDPWVKEESTLPADVTDPEGVEIRETTYRLGSVGQDCCLCLWDLLLTEAVGPWTANQAGNGQQQLGTFKRVASSSHVNIPTVSSSASLSSMVVDAAGQPGFHSRQASTDILARAPSTSSLGLGKQQPPSHQRQPSQQQQQQPPKEPQRAGSTAAAPAGAAQEAANGVLTPAVPHSEMLLIPPKMQHRVHVEPLSDILFTEEAIFTACYSGAIKCWLRPSEPGS